jgi:hypothetical protein
MRFHDGAQRKYIFCRGRRVRKVPAKRLRKRDVRVGRAFNWVWAAPQKPSFSHSKVSRNDFSITYGAAYRAFGSGGGPLILATACFICWNWPV